MAIAKAAVIGAGVMGAGIAAHIANAGVPVLLLDIVPKGATNRNAIAEGAIEKLLKSDPAALMHKRNAGLIEPGNIEDDLGRLAEADWIVEAVLEDVAIKQSLYRRIENARKPGSAVSSNTSTIPLAVLTDGLPANFARDFLITHFFNPPRYMRLLEIVAGPTTRPETAAAIAAFADVALGKGVVTCKDTPGFIANRIGAFWMQCAVAEALDAGLTVEEADAVMGRPIGVPKTGIFALMDLVGLDLQPHVDRSLAGALAKDDAYHGVRRDFPLMTKLIAEGYTGRKGKGGFYRLARTEGARVKEAIDLGTGDYRPAQRPRLDSVEAAKGSLRALVEHPDKGGRYAWRVLSRTLGYAAALVPQIADDVTAVDRAMRLGFNWKYGPFELIDRLEAKWFAERLAAEGATVPPLLGRAAASGGFYRIEGGRRQYLTTGGDYADLRRPPGVLLLSDVKLAGAPVARNGSASLWDIGDGIACLEFHSKMNALDSDSLAMVKQAIDIVGKRFKGLVIHNEADNFSVGANIGLALFAANVALWPMIEDLVAQGQATYKALKYAPFPVVGAPAGLALGGGCEVLLHCTAVQAHAETYMGLVETGVGLVPAWGGCKELLARWTADRGRPGGPMPPVARSFETISMAKIARSAAEAKELLLLRPEDGVTMNRERLLADAKAVALRLAAGYAAPTPPEFHLPGPTARVALQLAVDGFVATGKATAHDRTVSLVLAEVLSGGDTDVVDTLSEDAVLAGERRAFMRLVRHPATLARVEHMLETGKPLRN
ncbi:MAG: 3-hydroxyacyl-CoA dehydrogenase NAD-binding domain-containing protein [Dongiaceae bacterium]